MARAWVALLGAGLLLQGIAGSGVKWLTGRTDDLLHNGLHAASGVLALAALAGPSWPRRFALAFGAAYLTLGVAGPWLGGSWLPLGRVDHVFHALVGAATVAVGAAAVRAARQAAAA